MGNKIRVFLALALIVGVVFWTFQTVRERTYSGARLGFKVGAGQVVVTNPGTEPLQVEMRAEGRTASFRVEIPELNLRESSQRQGRGSTAYHSISLELPPGQTMIDVTRGSTVKFRSHSSQPITAVVTPVPADSARNLFTFVGLVTLAALFYISRLYKHRWVPVLLNKLSNPVRRLRRAT